MAYTPSTVNDGRPQQVAAVALNSTITTLTTDSNNARVGSNPTGTTKGNSPGVVQQGYYDSLNAQSQSELVRIAMNQGKLDPTLIITQCSVPTAVTRATPNVDAIIAANYLAVSTLLSNNPLLDNSGVLTCQKYAWAEQLVLNAMANGYVSPATILATMSGGN